MQIAKKYLTEGLIQLTILLSLVGVRVDIDSYLTGYYPPLAEINLGPSSAYTQTPFHILRETLDGYGVHPKCPELDYFFASRRLLDEVRTLGSPRFHTRLNAWLVHQVSSAGPSTTSSSSSSDPDTSAGPESTEDEAEGAGEHLPVRGQEVHCQPNSELGQGPCGAGAFLSEEEANIKEEEEAVPLTQLAHSSTLEQESLLEGIATLSEPVLHHVAPATDIDWNNLLSVPDLDLQDLDSLVTGHLSELDSDINGAISQDVSLHDAMVTSAGALGPASGTAASRTVGQQQRTLLRLESTNSSLSDHLPGMAVGLAALPFASVCNLTGNMTSQSGLDGCLDEAVFDQINQLGLESLDAIDDHLNYLDCLDSQAFEDLDSDSGLSLESSYGCPVSPGSSEMSSSSSSYCEEEGGATGYSSEVDSKPSKSIIDHSTMWPPVDLSESVWHDHSYSSPPVLSKPFLRLPCKTEEPEEDSGPQLDDRELSRDELRARAMCIPFSVLQIVNMPVEEFMEVLDSHSFSAGQVTLLRDIRRRGKNKLAAQNCRKRKLDAITGLQEEVERLHAQRERLLREKRLTAKTMGAVAHQFKQLTRDVLSRLRDTSGRPLNPERFTLQCGANGRVVVQPIRQPSVSTSAGKKTDKRKKDKKQ